ncbi:transcription factor Adf-1-like [Calliphora vicina]|uniref:transcription factor Adf-1-like n=1 Tax=Calliphora vicina TaxID=7373 RepID=UPI00325BBF9E
MFENNKNKMKRPMKRKRRQTTDKLLTLDDDDLIHQVSIRPVIYDRSLKAYRKTSLRQQCWLEISEAIDAPEAECRKRWRSLRDSFAKHYKLSQRTEESVANKHRNWVFYDKMTFLIPYLDGVSYDLDKILDELGDISEDGQSINCDPVDVNAANEALVQSVPESARNNKDVAEHIETPNTDIQHCSVSVQATDFVSISMENPQQTTVQVHKNNNNNIDNNVTNSTVYPRQQHPCNNNNSSIQCGESNIDNCAVLLNSDEKFLISCAPAMRRLTYRQNSLARLKIQQILFDIEFQEENN